MEYAYNEEYLKEWLRKENEEEKLDNFLTASFEVDEKEIIISSIKVKDYEKRAVVFAETKFESSTYFLYVLKIEIN